MEGDKCPKCDGRGWFFGPTNSLNQRVEFICQECQATGKISVALARKLSGDESKWKMFFNEAVGHWEPKND